MDDDLASDYDVVVLGTGMPESILAAAAARNGKSVLHLDRREYYGNDWASFNLHGIRKWIHSDNFQCISQIDEKDCQSFLSEGETALTLSDEFNFLSNVKEKILIKECIPEETEEEISALDLGEMTVVAENEKALESDEKLTDEIKPEPESEPSSSTKTPTIEKTPIPKSEFKHWKDLESNSRKFNLDLAPKVLFSRGSLVNLLISSNIARYAEFKCVTRVLTYLNGKLEQVPCSRADVFSTRDVTIVEKRMLMKLLTFCMEYEQHPDEYRDFENKSFAEFLKARKLTPNVEHYVLHAIAMVEKDAPTIDGLSAVQRFLKSLGRYGNTPFLWPLYGSGELPQCFCRLCAVFGGVYCLKRSAEALILDDSGTITGIISRNKRINCKRVIMQSSYFLSQIPEKKIKERKISRAIFITDKSILKTEKEQVTLLRLPAGGAIKCAINVLELCPSSMACPLGLHVVHMTCNQTVSAEEDLKFALEILFETGHYGDCETETRKPKILWALYFNRCEIIPDSMKNECTTGITLTSGPGSDFDFDSAVSEAKLLFLEMFPEEEFLPRAPDPDEIILDSDENNSTVDLPMEENQDLSTEKDETNEKTTEIEDEL
uniref:Rab proteins geranylgeranyltransferase component A n=1 Tax=Strigamia maritima TaxID=126957 RepID=T1J4P5_STRMM